MIQKLSPLTCMICKSVQVSKNRAGTIDCDSCGTRVTKAGVISKVVKKPVGHTRRRNYPEGYFK